MTAHKNWINQIAQVLPEATHPWVFTALKQEPFVWFALQDEVFLAKAIEFLGAEARDWSPGLLALLSLNLPARSQWYKKEPLSGLDSELRQQVARVFESLTKGEELFVVENLAARQQPAWFSSETLPKAGLLALALRERLRLLGSWSGLRQDLEGLLNFNYQVWKAPLACLFSLISDPGGLLLELTSSGASHEMQSLAIHCLLANPLPDNERIQMLHMLLEAAEPAVQHGLLTLLTHNKPALAKELAAWLSGLPVSNAEMLLNNPGNDLFEQLLILSHQADIHRTAGHNGLSLRLIEQAQQLISRLQVDFSARWAAIASKSFFNTDNPGSLSLADIITAWKQVCDLDQANPEIGNSSAYNLERSRTLIEAGEQGEIQLWLSMLESGSDDQFQQPVPVEIQAALTRHLCESKNNPRALAIVKQLIHTLQISPAGSAEPDAWLENLYGRNETVRLDILSTLAPLLLELGQYQQCIWVIQEMLVEQPDNVALLRLLSTAYQFCDQVHEATLALELAVHLDPQDLSLRRDLADCLESSGDAVAALDHRFFIVEQSKGSDDNTAVATQDLEALAACAITAGKPETAVELCQKLLVADISNWRAYTLLGKAIAIVENPQAGLANLQIASQLAPDQPEPWLEIAEILQKTGQSQEAILALQAAVQAAPESGSIHLALGKALLDENSLTSAVDSLNQAYEFNRKAFESKASASKQAIFIQSADYLGQALRRLGHLNDSLNILEPAFRIIEASPQEKHPGLRYSYAQTLLALGDTATALPILAQVVSAQPEEEQPYIDYASTILKEKADPEEAVQVLKYVRSINPEHSEAQALLADALASCRLFPDAKQAYLEVMDSNLVQEKSWQERVYYGLGRTALAMNEVDTAIAALQDAAQANPRNPGIQKYLADACWAASLDNDAWIAARNALQLDPSNPEVIAWFADHAIAMVGPDQATSGVHSKSTEFVSGQPGTSIHPVYILNDALNAINQVYPKFVEQADMVVRQGKLYALSGQNNKASESFRHVSQCLESNPQALQQAGCWLFKLNDINAAVQAFEQAQMVYKRQNMPEPLALSKDLIQAYLANGQFNPAAKTLQLAIDAAPQEADLYLTSALIENANGQFEKAIEFLADGITRCQSNDNQTALLYLAARLQEEHGFLKPALQHIENILLNNGANPAAYRRVNLYEVRYQAIKLSRGLLDNQRAQSYVSSLPEQLEECLLTGKLDDDLLGRSALDCYLLSSELALENENNERAGAYLANAEEILQALKSQENRSQLGDLNNYLSRIASVQARTVLRQGNPEKANEIIQSIVQSPELLAVPDKKRVDPTQIKPVWELPLQILANLGNPATTPQDQHGIVNAALEAFQWDQAADLAKNLMESRPAEPLYALAYVRCLVNQAEMANYHQDLGIVQHVPTQTMPLADLQSEFQGCMDQAEKALILTNKDSKSTRTQKVQELPGYTVLNIWHSRGLWALYPQDSSSTASSDFAHEILKQGTSPSSEEFAARLAALRRWLINQPDKQLHRVAILNEMRYAENFQLSPLVMVQKALLMELIHPEEALLTAQNLIRMAEESHAQPMIAQSHALMAILTHHLNEPGLALTAIQAALDIWPDEPRWHAIASQIYLHQDARNQTEKAAQSAIDHLEEAIQLEPHHSQHYIDLSKLLIQTHRYEPVNVKRVIRTLEKAVHYASELPAAWLALAKAYFQSNTPGNLDQAMVCIAKVEELASEPMLDDLKHEALLLRAEIHLLHKEPKEALRLGTQIRQAHPKHPQALMIQVSALEAMDRQDEALKELEKIAQAGSLSKELRIKQASLMGKSLGKNYEIAALNDLARENPGDLDILTALTRALMADGQIDTAIQSAQTALQYGPTSMNLEKFARMHHLLGNLLTQIGQLDQGVHHLSQSVKYMPDFIDAYLDLGSAYQKQRQHLKAQKIYMQAIQEAGYDARPYVQAALCLKEGKDYPGAESLLRKAAELAPHDVTIRKQLAAIVAINLVHNPHPVQTF